MLLYTFFIVLSVMVFSAINFNNFFKANKTLEANIFVIMLSVIFGYILTNFVIDFLSVSSII